MLIPVFLTSTNCLLTSDQCHFSWKRKVFSFIFSQKKKKLKTFMLSVWEKSRWSFKVSKYNKNGAIWKSLQILSNKTLSGLNKSYNISLPQEKFAEKSLHLPLIKLDLIISYLISYLVSLKMGYVITLLRYLRPW